MTNDEKLQLLIDYLSKNGGKYPSRIENKKLYHFITNLRTKYKMGMLSDVHIKILKSIKFEFNRQDQTWYSHYNALKDFIINNNGKFPRMGNKKKLSAYDPIKRVWIDEDRKKEYLLGKWIQTQRERMKNGTIKDYRKKLLESSGIPVDGYQAKWEDKYFELLNYVSQNDSLPNREKKATLINWFYRNLKLYDNMKLVGKDLQLFEALIAILPKDFRKKANKTWDERYHELSIFLTNYGHLPKTYRNINSEVRVENQLAEWVCTQKAIGRKHELPKDKLVKLENLGVDFSQINYEKDWLENYINYCDFINQYKREPINNCKSDYETKLSRWVRYNRNLYNGKYKNRYLPKSRYIILKNINFRF